MSTSAPAFLRAALEFLTLTAIGVQFAKHITSGFPLVNFFSYFTILANGIAGVVLLTGALFGVARRDPPRWYALARATAALFMTVVGLVFVTLLRNVDLGGLLPWINTVHHYVMPVAMLVDWISAPPRHAPSGRDMLLLFSFPLLYVVFVLVRDAATAWYPYPFFNPAAVGGTQSSRCTRPACC